MNGIIIYGLCVVIIMKKNKIIDLCSKYILSVDDLKKITFSKSLPKMQIKQDLEHDEILREFKLLQQKFNNDK